MANPLPNVPLEYAFNQTTTANATYPNTYESILYTVTHLLFALWYSRSLPTSTPLAALQRHIALDSRGQQWPSVETFVFWQQYWDPFISMIRSLEQEHCVIYYQQLSDKTDSLLCCGAELNISINTFLKKKKRNKFPNSRCISGFQMSLGIWQERQFAFKLWHRLKKQ